MLLFIAKRAPHPYSYHHDHFYMLHNFVGRISLLNINGISQVLVTQIIIIWNTWIYKGLEGGKLIINATNIP